MVGVHHAYGLTNVLDNISLTVPAGELVCLLGPSGCGKTTLLRIAAGLERLQSGTVTIDEEVVASAEVQIDPERRQIGFMFQDFALFPHLTVMENVTFGLFQQNQAAARSRAEEMLEQVGMTQHADKHPHLLSGGQQQRAAIARALCMEPEALLFAEPTSALDPELSRYHTGPQGYNDTLHYGVTDVPLAARGISAPTDAAVDFLADAPADRPWCCVASYYEPNEAMVVGREAYSLYDVDHLALPINLRDDLSDRPNFYRRQQQIFAGLGDDEWRRALACYYGRISEIDLQLGRLIAALEARGQLDDTIVVFSSDHGKYVGSHGFEAHNVGAFEEIYNIPLVAAGPGIARGLHTEARVGLHDLCPTLCELAGGEAIDGSDSRSCASLLHDPRSYEAQFDSGYAEYHGTRFPLAQRICWQGDWKFVFNGFDFAELYNLSLIHI